MALACLLVASPSPWRIQACVRQREEKAAALWSWATSRGMEEGSTLVGIGRGVQGLGLFAKRSIVKGQEVLSVPKSLWIDAEVAKASAIGELCRDFRPWMALAFFLLFEKSNSESRWRPYIDLLPETLDSPLFWTDEELAELEGTQLLGAVLSYKEFLRSEYSSIEGVLKSRPDLNSSLYSLEAFTWAFGILRSRTFSPLLGDNVALVPLADLINHGFGLSDENPSWERTTTGMFSKQEALNVRAGADYRVNEEVFMQYGANKGNSQLAIDYGFVDPARGSKRNKFSLTLEISPTDKFLYDKLDIAEMNGLAGSAEFDIFDGQEPPEQMLTFFRLVALADVDAFHLEAIFRNTVWETLSLPVSRENEQAMCEAVIEGCRATIAQYSSTIEEDEALLAEEEQLSARLRIATVVRLGEKRILHHLLSWFEDRMARLDELEYYAERRLRGLGLVDDKGNLTPW